MTRTLFPFMLAACSAGDARSLSPQHPAPAATTSTRDAIAPLDTEPPETVLPPVEDDNGVFGAAIDETSFEFDPESSPDDPDPILDGIPESALASPKALLRYLQTRRARLAAVSRDGQSVLVLTQLGETTQAHWISAPLGMRRQVTFGSEPVQQVAFAPDDPDAIVYRSDFSGYENYQIFRLKLTTGRTTLLTDGTARNGAFRFHTGTGRLAYTSNQAQDENFELMLGDGISQASAQRVLAQQGQNVIMGWSRSGKLIASQRYLSKTRSFIDIVDVERGSSYSIGEYEPNTSFRAATFGPEDRSLFLLSDRASDLMEAHRYDLETKTWQALTAGTKSEVKELSLSRNGRTLALNFNVGGYSELELLDTRTLIRRRLSRIPKGVVSDLRFIGALDRLAFSLSTPTEPDDVYVYDIKDATLTRWSSSETGGIPRQRFVVPSGVEMESFDGSRVPGFYYRPRGDGPFPVLLWMHGGPEDQFRPGFDPIVQYFASELGIAVLAPNIRGSEGYGRTYLGLDDGERRNDAVKDVGATLDWIAKQEELDEARVGIHGASYGGYMVLSALVQFGDKLRAGSNVVGMSNLVTFLENTGNYRREVRRAEYGDERDPKMREYLLSVSPYTRAHEIQSPLLVAHGEGDPRVPVSEARAIVDAVRDTGNEAWFFIAKNDGHKFRKKRNRDTFYKVMVAFFTKHLLTEPTQPDVATDAPAREDSNPPDTPEAG